MDKNPAVDRIWVFLNLKDESVGREKAALWLLAGIEMTKEVLEGVPEVLNERKHLLKLIDNIEYETGVLVDEQLEGVETNAWIDACTGLREGGFTVTECVDLIADAAMLLRGDGVKLNGTEIDTALEAIEITCDEEIRKNNTAVDTETIVAGARQLGFVAPPKAVYTAVLVAAARQGADRPPIEELIDDGNGRVDLLNDELELAGETFGRNRKPMRPLTDDDLETYEHPPNSVGLPRRGRLVPFCTEESLAENVLEETLRCWYGKTLSDLDTVDAPTVLDEIVANMKVPKKSEGDDVGDPMGILADVAFALNARLGPSHPHLTPAGLLVLWMCTMEGVDIDRLMKYKDVPHAKDMLRMTDAGGTNATTAGTGDEYSKKYAGRRNQSILQEIALAMRGIKDTCVVPSSALMLTLTTLDGLNSSFSNESIYLEVHVKGINPQVSETRIYAHSISFSQVIIIPLTAPTVSIKISGQTASGKYIGTAETKYPNTEGQTLRLPLTPAELHVHRSSAKFATIGITTAETNMDPKTMSGLIESLGGSAQKLWAKDKLTKWVKVTCLLQAMQQLQPLSLYRGITVPAAIAQRHSELQNGTPYTWFAPCIASHDESVAHQGETANSLLFRSGGTAGIDVKNISYYPDEKTIITAPFATHNVEGSQGTAPISITMNDAPLLPSGGIVIPAALRRFYNSCLADLTRADEQLRKAQDRNWAERSRHLIQLVADGDLRLKLRDEKQHDVVPQVDALPDHLYERVADRLAPLPRGVGQSMPHGLTPLVFCSARTTAPQLLSELILLWFDKEGDVLDELMENLMLPDEATALTVLSHLAASLAQLHANQPRNWMEILILVFISLESNDVDRLCLLDDVPSALSPLAEKEEYVLRMENSRNVSILPVFSSALASMADYQLSATLASNASEAKRAALIEPYKASKEIVSKWIKIIGLTMAMCEPISGELVRCATPAPGETERISSIETGSWGLWAAPSLCSREEVPVVAREGALKVKYTIKGIVEALDLSPYRAQHCPGDTSPAILLPPFVSYLIGDIEVNNNNMSIELLTRDVLSSVHPAIRKWREAIDSDSLKADSRLKEAHSMSVKLKQQEMVRRHEVSLGKRVVLPSVQTVHTTLETQKEYRYLIQDEVLTTHCDHASVGTVGNVTDAVVTNVSDLRRNMRELAAEMRGEVLHAEYKPPPPPPKVVSVAFDDGSIYLLPTELLTVHPVSWMPKMPSTVQVCIRYCELEEGVQGARARMLIDGGDDTRVTDAPLNDQASYASVSLDEEELDDTRPPVRPGDPARPVWEEAFDIEVDKIRLAEAPLELLFNVFAETIEEEMDEYDYIVRDLNEGEDESVIGVASLTLPIHILLENIDKPRQFPLALKHPKEGMPDTMTVLKVGEDPIPYSVGTLHISLQMIKDDTEEEEEELSDPLAENAEPLSWRKGEYASDRICTACDVGGEEYAEARYVCAQCDAKLCEDCWEMDHKDPKTHDHKKLLLYYHCDFCFVDTEMLSSSDGRPALWACEDCDLNLCKSCWYDEHKHPQRRSHEKEFLYPGTETGEWAAATVLAQTVSYHTDRFFSDAISFRTAAFLLCGACNEKDAVYSWPVPFEGGEGFTPFLLCSEHMVTQKQEHEDDLAEAEANNLPLPPERPSPTLLMDACYLCSGLEGKPAVYTCKECNIPLCSVCWKNQHRHPQRRSHKKEVNMQSATHGLAHDLLCKIEDAVARMEMVTRVEEPLMTVVKRSNEADVWRARLRAQEEGLVHAVEVAEMRNERDERARARSARDGEVLTKHNGYISSGGDIGISQRLTIEEAKEMCLKIPDCKGFTFKEEPHNNKVRVFFKNTWNLQGRSKGWTSFRKEDKPILGLCHHGALKAYCGECHKEKNQRKPVGLAAIGAIDPAVGVPSYKDPDALEARLANMIWNSA